jgi:hypothetical protein
MEPLLQNNLEFIPMLIKLHQCFSSDTVSNLVPRVTRIFQMDLHYMVRAPFIQVQTI